MGGTKARREERTATQVSEGTVCIQAVSSRVSAQAWCCAVITSQLTAVMLVWGTSLADPLTRGGTWGSQSLEPP